MRDAIGTLAALPLARLYVNTALFAGCTVFAQLGTSATAAYAFARLRFPGRERLFAVVLALLTVPAMVLLVPRFLMIDALGWADTYPGLVATELVSVWGIFLLRQCFLAVPRDLEDAARLDGAGEWTIFRRVVLPQARPALAALAVIAFAEQWKSFLWPLVVIRSPERQVVEVGLAQLHGAFYGNWPFELAVAGAAALPTLVLYVVGQKQFVRGVEMPVAVRGGQGR
jgi:multiple sugar transport system permease protein